MNKYLRFFLLFGSSSLLANPAMQGYSESNVYTNSKLQELYKGLNKYKKARRFKVSQCYDRAHYWSYQMYKDHGIRSTKNFIFFTTKYKREIFGQWWFHVAPGVLLNNEEYITDPEFLGHAVPYEAWKNGVIDHAIYRLTPIKIRHEKEIKRLTNEIPKLNRQTNYGNNRFKFIHDRIRFLKTELSDKLILNAKIIKATPKNYPYKNMKMIIDIKCPDVTAYSQYVMNQEEVYCYRFKTNMYYLAPENLEELENDNKMMNGFDPKQVRGAFNRSFVGSRFPYKFD